ncbi:hypothetical protein [Mesorhizobium sp. M0013]|uniref:hypothetical protein n=1 Tax=Mesorhizobium sp. M0013 TaxID=2956841 RepID=UPI0033378412
MRFSVGEPNGEWLAHDEAPFTVVVSPTLHFHFGCVSSGSSFPRGRLLEYGIAVSGASGWDYEDFDRIVKSDALAYEGFQRPTFFLQQPGGALNVLYGSCRKIHDENESKLDALAEGDAFVAADPRDVGRRPAALCLGGDQIYADDVNKTVMGYVIQCAGLIESPVEPLPGPALALPDFNRGPMLRRYAKFTSDTLDNHIVRFSEYLALYGLTWNKHNWGPKEKRPTGFDHFFDGLCAVRRLLANVPTYMIFDDHDVTDDWNLSVRWREEVSHADLGRRAIANALMAYWLCQDFGNDPQRYDRGTRRRLAEAIERRRERGSKVEELFWKLDRWEFATPTSPLIYFLDTRTQRGYVDEPARRNPSAPAFLRSPEAWQQTMARLEQLLREQERSLPVVLVSAVPVFGFELVETAQALITVFKLSSYKFDFENWAANERQLQLFMTLMSGRDVVILSGDVHYAFTSTARMIYFDSENFRALPAVDAVSGRHRRLPSGSAPSYAPVSEARFIQLTSSALKNFADDRARMAANASRSQWGKIIDRDGVELRGTFRDEYRNFMMVEEAADGSGFTFEYRSPEQVRPNTYFRQRINDEFNAAYIADRNMGLVRFRGRTVTQQYLIPKSHGERSLSWDFANARYWS